VRDAVVLIDRGLHAAESLKKQGISLLSILKLDVMMTHYLSSGLIDATQYQEYLAYVHAMQAAQAHSKQPPASSESNKYLPRVGLRSKEITPKNSPVA
jgi:hypothetical protein